MKRYMGLLEPRRVMVSTDQGLPPIDFVPASAAAAFSWGDKLALRGARLLSFALLLDALGNEIEARQYRDRFMWRKVVPWSAGQPWTITDVEIEAVVADIKIVEAGSSGQKLAIDQQPIPRVSEGGIGVSGAPIVWGKDDK